jgi:outer membrane biosynthesis protein TonB
VTLEEIPDRFARLLIPDRKPEPPRPVEERKVETTPEPVKAEEPRKAEPRKAEADAGKAAEDKAARAAEVRKAVQSKGILRVLGALGPGTATGAVADVFGTGGGFGDVASALSGAGGVAIATDPSAGGARKGGGGGGAATIGDLATSGGGKVALGAKSEARVSGRVAAEDAEIDSPDIDQGKLGAFVRARINSIKTCYENALKRNPSLKGKIRIRFTILETGGLADIVVLENTMGSADVATCIASFMRSWRTPFHPAGTVSVEYPFVFTAQ